MMQNKIIYRRIVLAGVREDMANRIMKELKDEQKD